MLEQRPRIRESDEQRGLGEVNLREARSLLCGISHHIGSKIPTVQLNLSTPGEEQLTNDALIFASGTPDPSSVC